MKLNKEHDIDVFSCLIQGVFMRPFYIIKNKYGFYSVSFVNQTTGKRTAWKSTHTSDYSEAMLIASTWYKDGSPSEQARTALRNSKQENKSSGIDFVNSFVTSGLLRSLNIFRISVRTKSLSVITTVKKCAVWWTVTGCRSLAKNLL